MKCLAGTLATRTRAARGGESGALESARSRLAGLVRRGESRAQRLAAKRRYTMSEGRAPAASSAKEGLRGPRRKSGAGWATLLVCAAVCTLAITALSSGLRGASRGEEKNSTAALAENAAAVWGEAGPGAPALAAGGSPGCIHFMHRAFSGGGGEESEGALPARYRHFMAKWQAMNPHLCIAKRGVPDVAALLESEGASEWQELLHSYEHYIQKCDVSRYMLMFLTGGVYADLDVEVRQGLAEIERRHPNAKVFLGTERVVPFVYADAMSALRIRNGTRERTTRVANYWMMSHEPGHAFWLHVMRLARERAALPVAENYDIIYTTGPDLLTEAYFTFQGQTSSLSSLTSSLFLVSLPSSAFHVSGNPKRKSQ